MQSHGTGVSGVLGGAGRSAPAGSGGGVIAVEEVARGGRPPAVCAGCGVRPVAYRVLRVDVCFACLPGGAACSAAVHGVRQDRLLLPPGPVHRLSPLLARAARCLSGLLRVGHQPSIGVVVLGMSELAQEVPRHRAGRAVPVVPAHGYGQP